MKVSKELLLPFVSATVETFKVQCQSGIEPGEPSLQMAPPKSFAVGATAPIRSPSLSGSIGIFMSEKVFLHVVTNMFGEKIEKISPELQDAAAEILNIVIGLSRTKLKPLGHDIAPVIPKVVQSTDTPLEEHTTGPYLSIPFQSEAGSFQLGLHLSSN